MTTQNTDLEQFILWFSDQESIPLDHRISFLEHVQRVGGLDGKAQDFIDSFMEQQDRAFQQKMKDLTDELVATRTYMAFEKEAETSSPYRIGKALEHKLNGLAQGFKADMNEYEGRVMKREESVELDANKASVDKLKAAL